MGVLKRPSGKASQRCRERAIGPITTVIAKKRGLESKSWETLPQRTPRNAKEKVSNYRILTFVSFAVKIVGVPQDV